ncbi:MAG: hypothetical protein EPO35_10395 [Acidobacteria bacterium]|nr:MAG: hypothetical protein EPO35_10395 [Acidobacteriota bacterium]
MTRPPLPLTVSVTGHRVLPHPASTDAAIDRVLDQLARQFPDRKIRAVSALAEGADRVAAHRVLARAGNALTAVLPMPAAEYRKDFATDASQQDFNALLAAADEVVELPPQPTRRQAYESAGAYGLDRADVLLAIWDGLTARGPGGTAEVVAMARARRLPLAWINGADVSYENWPAG